MPKMSRAETAKVMSAMHDKLMKLAPIQGLSVGSLDDRSTWKIQFDDKATDVQRKVANDALAAFDVATIAKAA